MTSCLFITGSDTGVGKTFVTAGLTRELVARKLNAIPFKPVQTGVVPEDASKGDLAVCLAASGLTGRFAPADLTAYFFPTACSPHLAASVAGTSIDVPLLVKTILGLGATHDHVLVEGAGGVMVPLSEDLSTLDLMQAIGSPVLLVVDNKLGAINHALLSVSAIRGAGLSLVGIIWNNTSSAITTEERILRQDNIRIVSQLGEVHSLGEFPFMEPSPLDETRQWSTVESLFREIVDKIFKADP